MINIDALVPLGDKLQGPIKYDEFPHMVAIADKTKVAGYVDSMTTPAWERITGLCEELGIAVPGRVPRAKPPAPHSPIEADDDDDDEGENEQPEERPGRTRAETSKTGHMNVGKRTHPQPSPERVAGEFGPTSMYYH